MAAAVGMGGPSAEQASVQMAVSCLTGSLFHSHFLGLRNRMTGSGAEKKAYLIYLPGSPP